MKKRIRKRPKVHAALNQLDSPRKLAKDYIEDPNRLLDVAEVMAVCFAFRRANDKIKVLKAEIKRLNGCLNAL